MMNFVNLHHPYDWLLPIYIEYGMVGTMLICYLVGVSLPFCRWYSRCPKLIPETPWFFCRRGQKDNALHSMRRLYKDVVDYDYEEEYGIMLKTIENEREMAHMSESQSWRQLFKGADGVSLRHRHRRLTTQRRTFVLLVLVTGEIIGGNSLVSVYSTCRCSCHFAARS